MSELNFRVPYTKIVRLETHPNAEKLELAFCYGFQLVVQKGRYKTGDSVVFSPIDSILPQNIEEIVFGKDAKIKLHKSRVRQIKIRNQVSQGLIIDPEQLAGIVNFKYIKDEQDICDILGITKYEPPAAKVNTPRSKTGRKVALNPNFHCYNGLTNIKWTESLFEGEEVVIQCKLHGTNARFGCLPRPTRNIWDKFLKLINKLPSHEFCYGSNRVDISGSNQYSGFYGEDIYGNVFKKIQANLKVNPNETIFGEIIGPGIQKEYAYGLKEHTFVLFDVKILNEDGNHTWLNPEEVEEYAKDRGFEFVPVLYKGIYNKELSYGLTKGPSVYCPSEPVREGIVIKSRYKYSVDGNKRAVKWINEDYLANQDNTDNH